LIVFSLNRSTTQNFNKNSLINVSTTTNQCDLSIEYSKDMMMTANSTSNNLDTSALSLTSQNTTGGVLSSLNHQQHNPNLYQRTPGQILSLTSNIEFSPFAGDLCEASSPEYGRKINLNETDLHRFRLKNRNFLKKKVMCSQKLKSPANTHFQPNTSHKMIEDCSEQASSHHQSTASSISSFIVNQHMNKSKLSAQCMAKHHHWQSKVF
jgi:hypothetical protein